jgi:hypothetical protein
MLLKQQNLPWLGAYLIGQAALLCWFILGWPTTPKAAWEVLTLDWTTTGVGVGISFLGMVASAFLTPDLKATLVFLRWHHPLPGSRAFSKLAQGDPRVDLAALRQHHNVGTEPEEQNRLWYRIYRQHEGEDSVRSGHLEYLLFRDLASMTALLATLGTAAIIGAVGRTEGLIYAGMLLGSFLMFRWIAARKGERFVTTVLACESAALRNRSSGG